MLFSYENIELLHETINATNLPPHIKNKNFLSKYLKEYAHDPKKSLVENNKSFLMYYIKLPLPVLPPQEINFDNELKKHQLDLEETITLKKPKEIEFSEKVDDVLNMDELELKMKEREKELEAILQQQDPPEKPVKKVTFDETPDMDKKLEIVLVELSTIKQELAEIKKMFLVLTNMIQSQ